MKMEKSPHIIAWENKTLARGILSRDHIIVNMCKLERKLGRDPARLICRFIQFDEIKEEIQEKSRKDYDGWFAYSQQDIYNDCNIPFPHQTRATKFLVENDFLFKKRMGIPSRNFFRINFKTIADLTLEWEVEDYGKFIDP